MNMFGQKESEEAPDVHGGMKLVACGPSSRAVAIVKNKLRLVSAAGPGLPVCRMDLPLPMGKVISLHADGPVCVTSDGWLHLWSNANSRWERIGNLTEGAS
jgi:hypothetical protein